MIILDTNVVSEFIGSPPHPNVSQWLKTCSLTDVCLTSIQIAEVLSGFENIPDGRRKTALVREFRLFRSGFPDENILPFGEGAAEAYASIVAQRTRMGRPISVLDAQIASIAYVGGHVLATRNERDFDHIGLRLINPFEYVSHE